MYPSYPPPIPLWAIGKPRRKFVPYFGKHFTTTTTTTTTSTTTPKPAVLDSSCSHLPSTCWNNSPYLPLPIDCIGLIQNIFKSVHGCFVLGFRYLCRLRSFHPPACDVNMCIVSIRESPFTMYRNYTGKLYNYSWRDI